MARKSPEVTSGRPLPAKELRELLKLPWVRDEALSRPWGEARRLPDGRFLLCLAPKIGVLFPSRDALEQRCREDDEMVAKGPVDLTRTLLPPVQEFLRDVEEHAKRLGKAIRVSEEVLDFSEESLGAVDDALWKLKRAKRMTPEVITPLTAYVGLYMLRVCDGTWTTETTQRVPTITQNPDGTLTRGWTTIKKTDGNEPMITARDGRLYQPFAIIIVQLETGGHGAMGGGPRGSIRSAVGATLLAKRLGGNSAN